MGGHFQSYQAANFIGIPNSAQNFPEMGVEEIP